MGWFSNSYVASAGMSFSQTGINQVSFTNTSSNSTSQVWDFGDGSSSMEVNPVHVYPSTGTYQATLIVFGCNYTDTLIKTVLVESQGLTDNQGNSHPLIYPNPVTTKMKLPFEFGEYSYTIMNAEGKTIQSGTYRNEAEAEISVAGLGKSFYVLEIRKTGSILWRTKFLKD
jgi:PKD repeat protein